MERESTNRDAVVLGIVFLVAAAAVPGLLRWLTDLDVPLRTWLEVIGAAVCIVVGFALGLRSGDRPNPNTERYAEHVWDALESLQKMVLGAIAPMRTRDFVLEGLLEPAHEILADEARGFVRFSVLSPDGDDFVMRHALGHSPESRREFRMSIHESFAGLAYNEREPKHSDDTERDARFKPHPKAKPGREYRSILAVPLWEGTNVIGVFVAVAQNPNAFTRGDRIYLRVLGAIMDVARAIGTSRRDADDDHDDHDNPSGP